MYQYDKSVTSSLNYYPNPPDPDDDEDEDEDEEEPPLLSHN